MNVLPQLARGWLLLGALALAAPAAAQAPGAPPAAPGAAPVDPQVKGRLENIHTRNIVSQQYAALAEKKATTPSLKQLATRVNADHARFEQELKAIATERGIQLTPDATIAQAPQFKPVLDRLNAASGPEFDRLYAEMAVADRTQQVEDLKALRDQTPGRDARLKKWLDDAENVMEAQRNQARVALKDVTTQQRQGRTPRQ